MPVSKKGEKRTWRARSSRVRHILGERSTMLYWVLLDKIDWVATSLFYLIFVAWCHVTILSLRSRCRNLAFAFLILSLLRDVTLRSYRFDLVVATSFSLSQPRFRFRSRFRITILSLRSRCPNLDFRSRSRCHLMIPSSSFQTSG